MCLGDYSDPYMYLYRENVGSLKKMNISYTTLPKKSFKVSNSAINTNSGDVQNSNKVVREGKALKSLYGRVLTITDTIEGTQISISVSQPRIGNRLISFNDVNDTLPEINADNCLFYLSTKPTKIMDEDDTLNFGISVNSKNLKKELKALNCNLKEHKTSAIVSSLTTLEHSKKNGSSKSDIKALMKTHKNKELVITLNGLNFDAKGKNLQFSLAHVYKLLAPKDSLDKQVEPKEIIEIPKTCELSGNYPNPFNPSTEINYQLSEVCEVKINVYDILGREVATLVQGLKEAGYYTASFNGSNLASGIYFARLIAIPQDGSKQIIQVKKMLLSK